MSRIKQAVEISIGSEDWIDRAIVSDIITEVFHR